MAKSKEQILKTLEDQAAKWIVLGVGVAVIFPILIISWEFISTLNLIIPIVLASVIGIAIWWFWTMNIIFTVLKLQKEESMSLELIFSEVKKIREEIQKEIRDNLNK